MQTSYKRFSVVTGFALLLVLLIANAFVTRHQLSIQVGNQAWVVRTQQALFELSQTELLIKDAETWQRGFLYTGDPKYLTPYNLVLTQVDPHLEKLAQLTAYNPRQQLNISLLRTLLRAKLSEMAQTILLYRSGKPEEAKALVQSDKGLFLMDEIRKLTNEMGEEETSLETTQIIRYRKSIRVTVACIYLVNFIAALGLILLAYYILQEMKLRERHGRQIAEREEWFRVTLTSLGDAVIATDQAGHVTFLNPEAERLIGLELKHTKGKTVQEIFPIFNESTHQAVENPVQRVMELGHVVGLANHTVLQQNDGTLIPIEDSAAPIRDSDDKLIGVVLVFRDATQERRSQDVLRKTEKLAAAARLAATVAHEINNPLEAVGNLIYITKGMPDLPTGAAEQLTLAEAELERVSHITRQTLGFYRESNVPEQIEMSTLLESVLKIYSNKFKAKNITVERDFRECPSIQGLSGELKQVMANLISNAADAATENGMIRVKLFCVDNDNGRLVQVSIEDDGPGIAAEHKEQIFEAFFTTKKDVGTGLGLWVTKEIVDRHGGSIQVHNRDDNGSSGAIFNVLLPLTADVRSRV